MRLYKTPTGPIVEADGRFYALPPVNWDELVNRDALRAVLADAVRTSGRVLDESAVRQRGVLPPIGSQEVWAAGVTYLRSKVARMEESKAAGGGDFYDKVYAADRPELFFKSMPYKVVGPGQPVRIRKDSRWNVPEPELTLLVNSRGAIAGYTIGNDMSSRDIEGENPLYLPQAKVYAGSCALAPGIRPAWEVADPAALEISVRVVRAGATAFEGSTSTARMRRSVPDLVAHLVRAQDFPAGAVLSTGTGIVPGLDFTLLDGDVVEVTVEEVGTLRNPVVGVAVARSRALAVAR